MSNTQDSEFYRQFKGGMGVLGLPTPPETLFGGFTLAIATIKAMSDVIGKMGTKVTVKEMILAFPAAGSSALVATAAGEALALVGAMTAAFYLGACAGCALAAAVDVYGSKALDEIGALASYVRHKMGRSLYQLIRDYQQVKNTPSVRRLAMSRGVHYASLVG